MIHIHKKTQCDGDLFEDQLSEADEENATSTLIENHPEREITDQNPEKNTRRSERSTKGKPPERLVEVINKATTLEREPRSYKEAVSGKQAEQWRIAMDEEIESLKQNGTWI